jgi:adenylylsulfate kinase
VFAVWLTGLPASGKSTIAKALEGELASRGVRVALLESDALRRVFTPRPTYSDGEREVFYGSLVFVGKLLVEHGVPVIFDATAIKRRWRDRARAEIPRFAEVHVVCPVEVCAARDPKGIYRMAREGRASTVPGVQAEYEPPERPEVTVRGDAEDPRGAAGTIVARLVELGFLP